MKILSLKLKGYKRLDLLGVDTLEYTPQSPYQLILGTNGAGKSSILNELSPLPIESNALRENGYKIIEIEHRNVKYTLSYNLHKKLECSFIRDNVELNNGGTIKVQKDLILEHFNYDSQLHDVLIGFTLLSNMSPQQRREWFVKMSKADMTYAVGVYNKLRSAERDIKGALKINNQRLINEQARLPSTEDMERIRRESDILRQELNHLLPFSEHGLLDLTGRMNDLLDQLEVLSSRFMDTKFTMKFEGITITKQEKLNDLLRHLQFQEVNLKDEYKRAVNELAELQDILVKSKQLEEKPLSVIDEELDNIRALYRKVDIELQRYTIKVGDNVAEQLYNYNIVSDQLRDILTRLPNNQMLEGSRVYTRPKYDGLLEKIRTTSETRVEQTNRLKYLEEQYKHLTDVHDVNCPQCNHSFKPGVDCQRLETLEKRIPLERIRLDELDKALDQLHQEKQSFDVWVSVIKQLRQLQERFPIFNQLFMLIQQDDRLHDYPIGLISVIEQYYQVLLLNEERNNLTVKLNQLNEERIRRVAAEGQDMEYIIHKVTKLELYIQNITVQAKTLQQRLSDLQDAIHSGNSFIEQSSLIKSLRDEIFDTSLKQVKYENNARLQNIIADKQNLLANNERFVNSINQTEGVINQLTESVNQLSNEQVALQILTTLLSPQDGLIAESLIGFLNQFLNQMGNILDQIWVYEMRPFLDIDEEGVDLDYRFKVDIEGLDSPVSDVSRLSRGQKEIVDFVFKLLLMHHLGMQDYPLFMDEVGGTFDATHRDNLYRYIKLLVESNQCQQVFIISHIASSHEALTQADKCVLDANAVMVDSEVNKVFNLK